MNHWDQSVTDYFTKLGIDAEDIELIKKSASGEPLYSCSRSAVHMTNKLNACIQRYGNNWPLYPDMEMLLIAGLCADALILHRFRERGDEIMANYNRDYFFQKNAREARSSQQSEYAKKGAGIKKHNKEKIEEEIRKELPTWNRSSAGKLERRLGFSATYIRKLKMKL